MNREIKFKVWDKEEGRMSEAFSLADPAIIFKDDFVPLVFAAIHHERFTFLQFTGLKDKTGLEIFEGDIVKTDPKHSAHLSIDWCEYSAGEVIWMISGFEICQKIIGATPMRDFSTCDCCPCGLEIIGNIFQNPEEREA